MFITGLGTATPPKRYTQLQCWEALQASPQFPAFTSRSRAILRKVLLGNNGIATRHLALDPLAEVFDLTPDALHARFVKHAPEIATEAARKALADAQTEPAEIDAVIISTCTGYLCPGLTSYVSENLGLRPDVFALDLVGQGCGAALPNMRAGEALISAGRTRKVLSVCVEICSAAFYLDNEPGVLVSACLFGDGAGAAVLSAKPEIGRRAIKWTVSRSILAPRDRDLLRFEQKGGMLRNILSLQVPSLAARHAEAVLQETLREAGVERAQISAWIFHAGGRDVLQALKKQMDLGADDLARSGRILAEFGNLSSPFVYFVLQETLRDNARAGWWWMASFGAGFSSHGVLLQAGEN